MKMQNKKENCKGVELPNAMDNIKGKFIRKPEVKKFCSCNKSNAKQEQNFLFL